MDCHLLKLAVVFGVLSFTLAELDDKRQIAASSAHSTAKDKHLPRPYDGYKDSRKYFQDIYVAQLIPEELEFGHVHESPTSWEQRFEKINMNDKRHQGKVKRNYSFMYLGYYPVYYGPILAKKNGVLFLGSPYDKDEEGFYPKQIKWGNKDGGYGEYYFDFNHDKEEGDEHSGEDNDSHAKDEDEHVESFDHKDKKKKTDVDFGKGRHLGDAVEVLPGYKLDLKKPYHGGNYRKLE